MVRRPYFVRRSLTHPRLRFFCFFSVHFSILSLVLDAQQPYFGRLLVVSNCDCYLAHMDHFLSTSVDPECFLVSFLCLPFASRVYLPILDVSFSFFIFQSLILFSSLSLLYLLSSGWTWLLITFQFSPLHLWPCPADLLLSSFTPQSSILDQSKSIRTALRCCVFPKMLEPRWFSDPVYSPPVRRRGSGLLTGYPPHYRISAYFRVSGYTTSSLRCVHVSLFSLLPFFKYTTPSHHVYLTILLLTFSGRVDCSIFFLVRFDLSSSRFRRKALPVRAARDPWLQVHPLFPLVIYSYSLHAFIQSFTSFRFLVLFSLFFNPSSRLALPF